MKSWYVLVLQFFVTNLLRIFLHVFTFRFNLFIFIHCTCRKAMFIKRRCRLWFTPFLPLLRTTLKCGLPPPPPTATNVRGCCGVLHVRACAARSVASNATTSVKICLMLTVCRVSSHSFAHTLMPWNILINLYVEYVPCPPPKLSELFCTFLLGWHPIILALYPLTFSTLLLSNLSPE